MRRIAALGVDHRKQPPIPDPRPGLALVTQRHPRHGGQRGASRRDGRIGQAPDHHRIGPPPQCAVFHDHAQAGDDPGIGQRRDARDHRRLVMPGQRIGPGRDGQTIAQRLKDRTVAPAQRAQIGGRAFGQGAARTIEAKAKVDVERPPQRQRQHRQPAARLDPRQRAGQLGGVGRGGHEPQVPIGAFAQIGVVHPRLGPDDGGHGLDPVGRHGQRRQRGCGDRVGPHRGADARDAAIRGHGAQPCDHLGLADAQRGGDGVKGARGQRKIALEVIQQAVVDPVHHSPIRCARAVKKMPDGDCAATSPSFSKLVAS